MTSVNDKKCTIQSVRELKEIMFTNKMKAAYLFIGNGQKYQYQDMKEVERKLSIFLDTITNKHGNGSWLAVYGGDSYIPDKPDLGTVMAFVKNKYNVPILSIQGWPEIDNFVDYTWMYKAEKDENERILYGGVTKGSLFGGTKIYLGDEFRQILNGVINLDARGRVGKAEIVFAQEMKLNVVNITPLKPRNQ